MENSSSGNFPWDPESRFNFSHPKERVRFVMDGANMCPRMFGEYIGQPELFRNVFFRNMPMTETLADSIRRRFPQIDPDWLLNGPEQ